MAQMCCDFTTSTAHLEYKSGTNANFSNIILKKGNKIRGVTGRKINLVKIKRGFN
jgi:hypothetical protein